MDQFGDLGSLRIGENASTSWSEPMMSATGWSQTFTWDGGALLSDDWTSNNNWEGDIAPGASDVANIIFAGAVRLTPNVDVNFNVNSIVFNATAGAFVNGGNQLTVEGGGITNNSTNLQTFNNAMVVGAAQTWGAASGGLSFTGTVNNDGNLLTIGGAQNTTISGAISGAGGLTKNDAGTLTLSAVNSFAGNVTVNAGTVLATIDGALPDVAYTVNGGTLDLNNFDVVMTSFSGSGGTVDLGSALLTVNQTATTTYQGVITGTGSLTKDGTGTLILTGANNYSGGTTVTAGTLQGDSTSLQGDIVNNATVIFNQAAAGTYADDISGTGSLTKQGAGTLTMTGTNSYSGGTTISQGTLQGDTDSLQGNITNNAAVVFDQAAAGTYTGNITGTGSFTKSNAGVLTVSGANSYSGGTTITAGTLRAGSPTGLVSSATNSAYTINGGVLDVNGNSVQMSSLTGAVGGVIDNVTSAAAVNLTVNQTASTTYAGTILDTGAGNLSLIKSNTGTLALSGVNTYAGTTSVNAGRLNINTGGSIASATSVAANASLGVNGTINGAVNNSGTVDGTGTITGNLISSGTVAPGNSIGTLNVNGSFTNNATGAMNIEINDAGGTDVLNVGTSATINGGTVNVDADAGSYTQYQKFTFVTTNTGVTGQFANITDNLTSNLKPVLGTDGTDVFFTLLRNGMTYEAVGRTSNQRAVGRYLDQIAPTASGDLQTIFDAINNIDNPEARVAYTQLSGDIHGTLPQLGINSTSTVIFQIAQRLRSGPFTPGGPLAVADAGARKSPNAVPLALVSSGPDGEPIFEDYCDDCGDCCTHWSGWVTGFGGGGSSRSDGNVNGLRFSLGGTAAGIERWSDDCHLIGFYGAYVGTGATTDFSQTSSINGGQFGAYVFADDGCNYYTLLGGFEFDGIDTHRRLLFDDIDRRATSSYDGWEGFAYLERGWTFQSCTCVTQPFLALQYIYQRQNSFQETGADSVNLISDGSTTDSLRMLLGSRMQYAFFNHNGRRTLPGVHLLWLHEFLDSNTAFRTQFTPTPQGGTPFTITGLDMGRDWAIVGANITWEMHDCWSMYVNYDVQTNSRATFHIGSGGLGTMW